MLHIKLRFKVKTMTNVLTIGRVARQAGLKPSAVRYYERHRIIPPAQRLPNGYRVYDAETLRWLSFVRRAQGFGMSLENVRELLQLASHGRTPCERVRQLAQQHVSEIDQNIRDLQTLKSQLELLIRRKAASNSPRHFCPLIES
jgi:DNA-binding transcriptional MerR regulator